MGLCTSKHNKQEMQNEDHYVTICDDTTTVNNQIIKDIKSVTEVKPAQVTINNSNKSISAKSPSKPQHKKIHEIDEKLYEQDAHKILIENAKKKGEFHENGWHIHSVSGQKIDCPHILNSNTENPMKCPIYYQMKQQYRFNQKNLDHLDNYYHFNNEFQEKPQCRYGQKCNSYIRLEKGDGNRIDDKCHMKLYCHPPRTRQIKLAQNINPLLFNKSDEDCSGQYEPTDSDWQRHGYKWDLVEQISAYGTPESYYSWINVSNNNNGWLQGLIEEVIGNGYKYDLCLHCGPNEECKHNVFKSEYSILKVVKQKMSHSRHILLGSPLTKAQMLALILYTGCDCNYDLCASQRSGDYIKWKWFDKCLYNAISAINHVEYGEFPVYTGLNGVKLDRKYVDDGWFVTYVSTSWRKKVAKGFMGCDDKGMMIEISKDYKFDIAKCCDVSWISKFPDECEILFARDVFCNASFGLMVKDDQPNGTQTISLSHGKNIGYN